MSRTVERYQNPSVGDSLRLRLMTYNNNQLSDLHEVVKIQVYHLDPDAVTDANPDGFRLVEEFDGSAVTAEDTGVYRLDIDLESEKYVIGTYKDVWTVKADENRPSHNIANPFEIYPSLWYSTPVPVVYDFDFQFQPNQFRQGAKQYLIVEIIPNVPSAGDLRKYYENLAIVSDLKISIEQVQGECLPAERDLRMIADRAEVEYREKRFGYYRIDTTDMEVGVYDVWFEIGLGGNTYISPRGQIAVYE